MKAYFRDAQSWDQEILANMHASRKRAWMTSIFFAGISVLCLLTLLALLPLKSFAPYVVTVDRQTGYIEVTKGLNTASLSQEEAVTQSNLVRYVSARESYNPAILKENYELIFLMSADTALKEFQHLWNGKNKDNPSVKYGEDTNIDITIKSVSLLNENTASIRILRTIKGADLTRQSHWNIIATFRYTDTPMKMGQRFQNPLGFQVTNYRITSETTG